MSPLPSTTVLPSTASNVVSASRSKPPSRHPLDPLSPEEIAAVSLVVRQHLAETRPGTVALKFITSYLLPPPKRLVLAHLGIPFNSRGDVESLDKPLVRKAEVDVIELITGDAFNLTLSWSDGKWVVDTVDLLPEGTQPQISVEELLDCEIIVREDERIQQLAKDVGILPEQICCDGWAIGYDERFPTSQRLQQGLCFARLSEHDNLYAHPLDFIPVLDSNSRKIIHIDFPPVYRTSANGDITSSAPSATAPSLKEDSLQASHRERIPPPREPHNFLPDLIAQTDPKFKQRDDLKPLHVVQPEGVSFQMNGHELAWQKWKMHVAFNHREGIVLSTITYNDEGQVRPIFYRLSLAEMVVPYAAPEWPHTRKFAFDSGEYGMGTMANELTLGCDCLGTIHYMPGAYVGHDGNAIVVKNVICIHEEDAGVLWKHTDFRPGGRAHTARSRRLVISMVCTLANYEYIWNYQFYQDGSLELEIRLTGIIQTYVNAKDEPTPYGTRVAPGINGQYHSHVFSVRVDPMLDGIQNSVVETDIVPLPEPTGSDAHPAGNGFTAESTTIRTAEQGGRQWVFEKDRRWSIINPSKTHYSTGTPVGYTIRANYTPNLLPALSWASKRASFLKNALWVCPDMEDEKHGSRMWPSGKYVSQTRDEPDDSIGKWAQGIDSVDDEDILVYITAGTIHVPRAEDWPVMPVDHVRVSFKPTNFFRINPSMDVPGTQDSKSVAAFPNHDCCENGN